MTTRQLFKAAAALLASASLSAGAALPTVAAAAPEPARSFGMAGLFQAAFGLAMVLGLIFLCGWAARRLGLRQPGSGHLLKVVSSAMVGQRERVVVVEIGDSWLVLGVASGQVRPLHTMPAESQPDMELAPRANSLEAPGAFSRKLLDALGKLNGLKKQNG